MYSGSTSTPCNPAAVLAARSFQLSYCTGQDDLVWDFFVPAIERAELYRRAAGYFTSAGLALAARGVASLASRDGEMRLIVSPHLEPEDLETLQGALERPEEALRSITARSLDEIEDAILADRLNALAWLAASGRLKLMLALRVNAEGRIGRGLYHEKIGIFSDSSGGHVAFTGSSNETAEGLIENFESIDVFTSWDDSQGRVQAKIAHFEALWADRSPGVRVIEFSDVSRDLLDRFRDPNGIPPGMGIKVKLPGSEREFAIPAWLDLRDYQKEAIRAWSQKGGKGILAMATGSGKTLTALSLAAKVAERNTPLVLIVVCPFLNPGRIERTQGGRTFPSAVGRATAARDSRVPWVCYTGPLGRPPRRCCRRRHRRGPHKTSRDRRRAAPASGFNSRAGSARRNAPWRSLRSVSRLRRRRRGALPLPRRGPWAVLLPG